MSPCRQQIHAFRALLLLFTVSALAASFTNLAKAQETDFGQVGMHVANMLQNNHYSRRPFNDELSQQLLKNYLESLDYTKRFFTQEDVDRFTEKYGTKLDDHVQMQDKHPALEIYALYEQRVRERIASAKKLVQETEFTFDNDDTIEITRSESDWSANKAEADDLWRRIIKNQFLQEELAREGVDDEVETDGPGVAEPDGADGITPVVPKTSTEDGEKGATAELKEGGAKIEDEELTEEELIAKTRKDLTERWDRVLKELADNDEEEQINYFLSALAMTYDPHSDYFSHQEVENFQIQMRHSLTGIGATLSMVDGMAEIQGLVVGGPAHKSKRLDVEDKIVGVAQDIEGEMTDIVDMKLSNVVELIRGKEGSIVRLKIIPAAGDAAEMKEVAIVRDTVELKDKLANSELIITKDSVGKELRIGWIYLYSFYADMNGGTTSTTTDVNRLLLRLIKENIDGLVLDLRSNGGGSLEEAINLTGLFIRRGPVVQSKDWRDHIELRRSRNPYPIYAGPLTVLTGKASASASEILAAALQDYNRALIVGETSTFGKGTVQTIKPVAHAMPIFSDKERAGALKVTIQKFYRIAGGSTQLRGVIPDVILPSRADALDIGEASLKDPLPYDEIDPQPFDLFNDAAFPVAELSRRSEVRIENESEFQYILDDIAQIKDRLDKNVMSLNKEIRLTEAKENKDRNETRNDVRRKEFAEIKEDEKGLFTSYRITLDNVDETTLTLRDDFSDEEASGMITGSKSKEDDEDEKALEYPHGFDPVKRETLAIIQDYIEIKRSGAVTTVKVSDQ